MELLYIILAVAIVSLVIIAYAQQKRIRELQEQFHSARDTKMALAVKHGMTMEHFIPWTKEFDGDPRGFRFIGDPIDGVLFGKDKITFMEFKTGNAHLSEKQRMIRELVEKRKIEWKEIRI